MTRRMSRTPAPAWADSLTGYCHGVVRKVARVGFVVLAVALGGWAVYVQRGAPRGDRPAAVPHLGRVGRVPLDRAGRTGHAGRPAPEDHQPGARPAAAAGQAPAARAPAHRPRDPRRAGLVGRLVGPAVHARVAARRTAGGQARPGGTA